MMNVVNSFLTPQKSPCIRLSYVGNGTHPLPSAAKHTIIIIPYVKKSLHDQEGKETTKWQREGRVWQHLHKTFLWGATI